MREGINEHFMTRFPYRSDSYGSIGSPIPSSYRLSLNDLSIHDQKVLRLAFRLQKKIWVHTPDKIVTY